MAVEIPVVIDIDKAFQEASRQVPKAMKPLQDSMDENALAIKLKIDESGTKYYVKDILDDATLSAKQLQVAIQDIGAKIKDRSLAGGFDLSKGLTESEKAFLQAAGALENKLHGITDSSAVMGRIFAVNIGKAKKKVQELTATLDELTRKQNFNLKKVGDSELVPKGTGKNYEKTKERIAAVNKELLEAKNHLAQLTAGLASVRSAGDGAAVSVSRMSSYARQMTDEWRRGQVYVERWNAALGTANNRLAMLLKGSISLIALHSATRFVRNIREVTAEFEMQRVALGGIIQDTEMAESLFKRIKAAAIKSPFEIKDLVTFTKQLSAYRIETENLFDVTMKLADISAGLGVDMNRLVLAYGQVRAASVLRGQELRQFTEAGIPLVELLAKKFEELGRVGTTTADVFELISQRAVPFRMIEEIFNDMTDAGGIFYKMQEKQSETLKGQWMKLKDALSIMYDEIGNTAPIHDAMETLLKDAMSLLQNWREVAKNVKIGIAAFAAYKIALTNARIAVNALTLREAASVSALQLNVVNRSRLIASLFGEKKATDIAIKAGNLYVRAKKREMVATNMFTQALYRMEAALLKNPYAIAIAAITVLIGFFIKLAKSSREAAFSIDDFQKSLDSLRSANEHEREIKRLCDKYDELSAKTERSAEEQEEFLRISKELAKEFPAAVSGVDAYGNAVEINTEKVRNMTKEETALIKKIIERKKLQAEGKLEDLAARREEINKILREGGYWETGGTDIAPEYTFHALTDEDADKLGESLTDIIKQMSDLGVEITNANNELNSLADDMVDYPKPPDYFNDAWRRKINSYEVTLKDALFATKAFAKDQIDNFKSSEEAVDAAIKEYESLTETIEFYNSALLSATGEEKTQMEAQRDNAVALQGMYAQIITDYNAWSKLKDKDRKTSYQQDPFIQNMQDRMKFMQDFKKGYDDLNKYMSASDALAKQGGIMEARGLSLGLDPARQKMAASELSKWYSDAIKEAFEKAKKFGAKGNNIEDFLSQQIKDTTNRGKALRDFQKLIQSLWDAKTDFDTNQMARQFEDALKRIEDEIKRSETARNFYQNILDLTGDEQLAATMSVGIYGGIGDDFKANLQRQLDEVLRSLDASQISDGLKDAFRTQDFDAILKEIDKFPTEQQKILKQLASNNEKYNADIAANLIKSLQSAKTYSEKRVELAKQTATRLEQINAMNAPESAKEQLRMQNARKEAEEVEKLQYEAFKDSPMYVELFANLDRASSAMLRSMRDNLTSMKSAWKDLPATDLKEMQSRINELNSQLATKNPFRELIDSITEYRNLTKQQSRQEADESAAILTKRADTEKEMLEIAKREWEVAKEKYGVDSDEEEAARTKMEVQESMTDLAIEEAEAAQDAANAYRRAAQWIEDAATGLETWRGYISESLGGIQKAVAPFMSDDAADTFGLISDGIDSLLGGAAKAGKGIAKIMTGDLTGIVDIIGGIGDAVSGVALAIQGINIKKINKQIEAQQKKVEALDRSYQRLEKAIAKAFGSDYIYNYTKQLENLQAKVDAYNKQADLETSKGKKADKNKIQEYKEAAEDAAEEIADMKGQLAEFFTGTDVTSAAKDFANSWIEAYKEFGSTTSAMKEKFQDLIQSMVEQSIGAKIMQSILQPLFDSIDEMAKEGGELSAQEIAQIAQSTPEYIDKINNAMTNMMNQLTAAGYNMRQGVGQFTGISRDIAGASEESITGLAAGINTQNFYMSLISQNVAAILATLTGGAEVTGVAGAAAPEDPYKKSMLEFVGFLPQMHDDMYAVRQMLEKVIKPNGTASTHYVATRS